MPTDKPSHRQTIIPCLKNNGLYGKFLFAVKTASNTATAAASTPTDGEMAKWALENARDVYTRRQEGVSIWVVPSKEIIASNPDDNGELFEPAADKIYRHPTFYNLPDEVKHI